MLPDEFGLYPACLLWGVALGAVIGPIVALIRWARPAPRAAIWFAAPGRARCPLRPEHGSMDLVVDPQHERGVESPRTEKTATGSLPDSGSALFDLASTKDNRSSGISIGYDHERIESDSRAKRVRRSSLKCDPRLRIFRDAHLLSASPGGHRVGSAPSVRRDLLPGLACWPSVLGKCSFKSVTDEFLKTLLAIRRSTGFAP
jgi:hypothetical protein